MIDREKLADLIKRAEGSAEAPGGETGRLLKEAAKLLLTSGMPTARIFQLVSAGAHREAAMVLMEAVLPGWDWEKFNGNYILLLEPADDEVHFKAHGYTKVSSDDFARALLIATLKATEARG